MSVTEHVDQCIRNAEAADYHARPELSSSEIGMFLSDPIEWYHTYVLRTWKNVPTAAMQFGTNVHRMMELQDYSTLCRDIPAEVLNDDGHCKGKAWLAWKDANPAAEYVKPGEVNALKLIWENVTANAWIMEQLQNGKAEEPFFWEDEDFGDCRMKTDLVNGPFLIDWKTTSATTTWKFTREVVERHYDVRLAFYRRGFRHRFGMEPVVHVVAIQTSGGMQVTPYRIPDSWLDDAEARLLLAVDAMTHFSIEQYRNAKPIDLVQPRYSQLDLEAL